MKEGRPGYVPRRRLSLAEGVALIHQAGGLAVCAHPGLLKKPDEVLQTLVTVGLDGVEVIHSEHDQADRERFAKFAEEYGLLVRGDPTATAQGLNGKCSSGAIPFPKSGLRRCLRNGKKGSPELSSQLNILMFLQGDIPGTFCRQGMRFRLENG